MLGWASQQFEKLSQTVAPPPADANGRFVYAVQRGDEDGAMACVHEMDAARTVLNPTKGSYAIHLACLHSMERLIRMLLTVPGVDLTFVDSHGNTPLHYACMSTERARALPTIKMLVTEFKAPVITKNSMGQTPYDLASLDGVRQYLLPLQLQEETRIAIDNGGAGLPPGIDMGGLRISNPTAPPPPIMPMAQAPMSSPAPQAHQAPPQTQIPRPPTTGEAGYARTGGSSAAIYKPAGSRYVKADGFHSSSSDVNLQRKYGHVQASYANVPPPPSSGNSSQGGAAYAPPSGGANPFAGGTNPYSSGRANQRYVSYDAVTGQTSAAPRTAAPSAYTNYAAQANAVPNVNVFSPGGAPAPASGQNMGAYASAQGQNPNGSQGYPQSQPQQTNQPQGMASPVPQQQGYPGGQAQEQIQATGAQYGNQNFNGGQQQQQPMMSPPPFSSPSGSAPAPISGGISSGKADPGVAASLFSSPPSGGVGFSAPQSGGLSPAPKEAAANLFGSPAATNQGAPTQPGSGAPSTAQPGVDTAASMFASQSSQGSTKNEASNVFGPSAADRTASAQPSNDPANQSAETTEKSTEADVSGIGANERPPTNHDTVNDNVSTTAQAGSDAGGSVFSAHAADQSGPSQFTNDAPKGTGNDFTSTTGPSASAQADSTPSGDGANQGSFEASASGTEQKPSNEPSNSLPAGWKELMDPASGRPYYYNEMDHITSWERPVAATEQTQTAPLPSGWRELVDPSSGRPYYFNEVENTTSWERPGAPEELPQAQSMQPQAEPKESENFGKDTKPLDGQNALSPSADMTFSANAQEGDPANQFFGLASSNQTTPQETAQNVFGGPPGNTGESTSNVFGANNGATNSDTNAYGAPTPDTSTQTPAIAPASGGFSLNEKAMNSAMAADLFSSPSQSEGASPKKEPEHSGPDPTSTERVGSPDGSVEGLDDVPLSPDAPAHAPVNMAQTEASSAFSSPAPVQPSTNPGTAATPGGDTLFDAIGMPPPPFSARKK